MQSFLTEPSPIRSNSNRAPVSAAVVRAEWKRVSIHNVQSYTNPFGWKSIVLLQSVQLISSTDNLSTASGSISMVIFTCGWLDWGKRQGGLQWALTFPSTFVWVIWTLLEAFNSKLLKMHALLVNAGFNRSRLLLEGSYLVDPASSHMLVSKIKPCMSKCK